MQCLGRPVARCPAAITGQDSSGCLLLTEGAVCPIMACCATMPHKILDDRCAHVFARLR